MSNIDKQALREAAEKATPGEWKRMMRNSDELMTTFHGVAIGNVFVELTTGKRDIFDAEFIAAANPSTVLALLDELEAKDAQIVNLTAERDALREEEMGEAKHSNTRAAADIYFQLVEECEIHPGGSLVEYVSDLRERAAAACKGE